MNREAVNLAYTSNSCHQPGAFLKGRTYLFGGNQHPGCANLPYILFSCEYILAPKLCSCWINFVPPRCWDSTMTTLHYSHSKICHFHSASLTGFKAKPVRVHSVKGTVSIWVMRAPTLLNIATSRCAIFEIWFKGGCNNHATSRLVLISIM
jgi:hypothetical protein